MAIIEEASSPADDTSENFLRGWTLAGFSVDIVGSTSYSARVGAVQASPDVTLFPTAPTPPGPPNTSPIYGRDYFSDSPPNYIVASDSYLYLSAPAGNGTLFPWGLKSLTNAGTIYIEDATGAYGDIRIGPQWSPIKSFINTGTVVLHLTTDIAGALIGLADGGSDGLASSIENSGQIFLISDHFDARFYVTWQSRSTVVNSGLIELYTPEGKSNAIELVNGGTVTNEPGGQILVQGQAATAIVVDIGSNAIDVSNAGYILAKSLSTLPSVGIYMSVGTAVNSGTITADIAVYMNGTLTNSGTLNGAVVADEFLSFVNDAAGVLRGSLIGGEAPDGHNHDVVTNAGLILGNVELWGGDDVLTNSGNGYIVGHVDLGAGNDRFAGGLFSDVALGATGDDIIDGGAGDDTIGGGMGVDQLTGGPGNDRFLDTAAGLNGDTITDFSVGDKIVISDATLAGFTFSLSGNTLTYTGGSLTLSNGLGGHLVASAAAGGGVQLTIQTDPDNDFNGDGRSDVLWRSDSGQFSDWLGQANGGFVDNDANAFAGVPTSWHVTGTGDFNGDGRDDVLWRSDSGQLSDWLGQANGGFASNDANAFTNVPTSWSVAGVGDFNGDGRDDILWRSASGQLSDWLGQANGGFVGNDANAFTNVPTSWHVVETGDFNGDGRDDILWRSDSGQLSDWLGQANGGFAGNDANAFTNVPTSWKVVGTGDFNGDGRDDILWRSDSGQLSDWLGQANGGFAGNDANAFSNVPTSWHVADIGDYNGDGRDDILRRSDSGQLSDWLGQANGGFAGNDANAMTGVPTVWHAQSPDSLWL